jgi:hypothetical protein
MKYKPTGINPQKTDDLHRRLEGLEIDLNIFINQRGEKLSKKDLETVSAFRITVQSIRNELFIAGFTPIGHIDPEIIAALGKKLYGLVPDNTDDPKYRKSHLRENM